MSHKFLFSFLVVLKYEALVQNRILLLSFFFFGSLRLMGLCWCSLVFFQDHFYDLLFCFGRNLDLVCVCTSPFLQMINLV